MNEKEKHTQSVLANLRINLDSHDYDGADHLAHLLISSFCSLKHNNNAYPIGLAIKKLVKSLHHHGHSLDMTSENTKMINHIKRLTIRLYRP